MKSSTSPGDATNTNIVSQEQPIGSTVKESANGIAAALARSLARGAAIYFARPVRLFRATKGIIIDIYAYKNFFSFSDVTSEWMDISPRGCTPRRRLFDSKIYPQPYKERGGMSNAPFRQTFDSLSSQFVIL